MSEAESVLSGCCRCSPDQSGFGGRGYIPTSCLDSIQDQSLDALSINQAISPVYSTIIFTHFLPLRAANYTLSLSGQVVITRS